MAWNKNFTVDVNEDSYTIYENGEETKGSFVSNRTKREKIMIAVASYLGYKPSEVLTFFNRDKEFNDHIAMKIWTRDDLERRMFAMGYPVTESNVQAVINSAEICGLTIHTDREMGIISKAIKNNTKK